MTRSLTLLLLTSLALAAAGCGGSDNGSSSSSSSSTAKGYGSGSGATSAAKSGSGTILVDMKDFAFAPKEATAKVGQKVKWVNQDSTDHNVTDTKGGQFKSGDFGSGASFEFTPKQAGTIHYVCTLHPGMDGTLIVTK